MKTNISFIVVLSAMGFCSCLSQKYLPKPRDIGANPYGSHIQIRTSENTSINGELIATDTSSLYVKVSDEIGATKILRSEIAHYTLHVASTDHNVWIPIVFSLTSISHGAFGYLTLPINLPSSMVIGMSGYTLRQKNITFDQLRKFCRYPQGLPPDLPLSEIR